MLALFSKSMGYMESNEAQILAILEALQLFIHHFRNNLTVERDSLNVISLVCTCALPPRRFQFYFNEIKELSSSISVELCRVGRSANGFADSMAKQGFDRSLEVSVIF